MGTGSTLISDESSTATPDRALAIFVMGLPLGAGSAAAAALPEAARASGGLGHQQELACRLPAGQRFVRFGDLR